MSERRIKEEADEIRLRLQDIGRLIKRELPEGWGFTMLVASHGTVEGVTLYISTVDRADALQLMREFIATQRQERNWFQERDKLGDLDLTEDFEQWWTTQQKRRIGKQQSLKQWCQDAFTAGQASA